MKGWESMNVHIPPIPIRAARGASILFIIALSGFFACGNPNHQGAGGTVTSTPCFPGCNQSTASGTGQDQSQKTAGANASIALTSSDTQYQVVLLLPAGSSPETKDLFTLIINNPPQPPKVGDYLTFVAIATDPTNHTFTAQSVQEATQQAFLNQSITYHRGNEVTQVACSPDGCSGKTIEFTLNGLHFSFPLAADTVVSGFGSPPVIKEGMLIEVVAQFAKGQFYKVAQVTNLTPT